MKVVRIQVDMIYQLQDEDFPKIYEQDVQFYEELQHTFNNWGETESRIPVKFEVRHHAGEAIPEIDEVVGDPAAEEVGVDSQPGGSPPTD